MSNLLDAIRDLDAREALNYITENCATQFEGADNGEWDVVKTLMAANLLWLCIFAHGPIGYLASDLADFDKKISDMLPILGLRRVNDRLRDMKEVIFGQPIAPADFEVRLDRLKDPEARARLRGRYPAPIVDLFMQEFPAVKEYIVAHEREIQAGAAARKLAISSDGRAPLAGRGPDGLAPPALDSRSGGDHASARRDEIAPAKPEISEKEATASNLLDAIRDLDGREALHYVVEHSAAQFEGADNGEWDVVKTLMVAYLLWLCIFAHGPIGYLASDLADFDKKISDMLPVVGLHRVADRLRDMKEVVFGQPIAPTDIMERCDKLNDMGVRARLRGRYLAPIFYLFMQEFPAVKEYIVAHAREIQTCADARRLVKSSDEAAPSAGDGQIG